MSRHHNLEGDYFLRYLSNLSKWFTLKETPQQYLKIAQTRAQEILTSVPQAAMVLGSGYPYYVLGAEDIGVPEFSRFYTQVMNQTESLVRNGVLTVSDGGEKDTLPLKQLIRSLPDIDLFVVVEEVTEDVQMSLSQLLEIWSEPNPDINPHLALTSIADFLDELFTTLPDCYKKSELPPIRSDLYIATVDTFTSAYTAVSKGDLTGSQIITSAFHGDWHKYIDYLAEDIFTARTVDPLAIRPEYHSVFEYWLSLIQEFIVQTGSNDDVLEVWFDFLTLHTNGKNRRILESSPSLMKEMNYRISSMRSG